MRRSSSTMRSNLNGNTLTKIGDGTLLINNDLLTGDGGEVLGLGGIIAGSGVVVGDFVNSGGTLSPGGSGNDTSGQVPEPASLVMTLLGLAGLLLWSNRRGRHVQATVLLAAAGLAGMPLNSANAIPLRIDFGISDPPGGPQTIPVPNANDVQVGWEEFSLAYASTDTEGGRDGVNPLAPESRTYDGITVTVAGHVGPSPIIAPGFGVSSRDRLPDMNSFSSLGDMFEDVFNDAHRVAISGLPAGTYEVTSYHHDSGFGGSEADIFVDNMMVGNVTSTHHNNIHFPPQ